MSKTATYVGTVQQRLPRKRPSLPAVSMERVSAGIDRTKEPQRRALTRATKMHSEEVAP